VNDIEVVRRTMEKKRGVAPSSERSQALEQRGTK
jgi:hypothetical protein